MASAGVYPFEQIDDTLPYVPLAARRVLDALGRKLSLVGWQSLGLDDRRRLVNAGAGDTVDLDVSHLLDRATPAPSTVPSTLEPSAASPPAELTTALGPGRPLEAPRWGRLSALDRYTLVKYARKEEKLARAYEAIVRGSGMPFTHLNEAGEARMVDVGGKAETSRRAVASARVGTTREVAAAIAGGFFSKGDVLAVARVAGILAAKRTAELIPLCHPVSTTHAAVDFEVDGELGEVRVRATVEALDRTGVEMEAMVAACIASLTIYDMVKSADRWAVVELVRLEEKRGGKSGDVARPSERGGG
jgi:cyclic pyranopterin phosphate synthase